MRNDQTFRQELNQALDYADILDRIAGYASFSGSAARIREAMPVTDRIFVREQLDLAQEARTFTQNGQSASLAGITDIRSLLQMAQKGQVLTTQELLEVYLFLRAVDGLSRAFDAGLYPKLSELADSLVADSRLESAIQDAVGMDGTLKPDASPALVRLNRDMMRDRTHRDQSASQYDPKIAQALSYINDHLGEELTVDALARQVYTSKYHFMRRFKELTGCPVHQYITQKRLLAAAGLLRAGVSAQEACGQCGFQDYSAFHRAFRRQFGATPREFMP